MLQRIETPTGTGIPDVYCSIDKNVAMWIETKTTEYKVSNEQLNWAAMHWLTGGLTFVATRINMGQIPVKNPNQTAYNNPPLSSNVPAHALPYPQLPELFVGHYMQGEISNNACQKLISTKNEISNDIGIVSYDQLTHSANRKGQETLIFLSFDERMRDCSTLGVYLRRHNPLVLPIEEWVRHIVTRRD